MPADAEQMELALLRLEAHFLEAEYNVVNAEAAELRMGHNLWLTRDEPETQRLLKLMQRNLESCKRLGFPYGVLRKPITLEQSAYAWRRDYGEWPSIWNLADRYSHDRGIQRDTAKRAIVRAINDPSDRRQLHAIPIDLLTYILTADEPDYSSPEVQLLARFQNPRFYVAPVGLQQFACEDVYSQSVRCLERLTA